MSNSILIAAWVIGILGTAFSGFLVYEFLLEWATTDPYSYSNSLQLTTDHYDLRLELDFDKKVINGEQKLKMRTLSMFVMEAVLDVNDLHIHDILYNDKTPLDFKISRTKPEVGQSLHVRLPFQLLSNNEFELTIKYTTSPSATALSWLAKNQTAGGKQPYLFSQCETVHCRSIAPFQDTPAIKSTFNIHVHSPRDIVVRTSGNKTGEFDYDNHRCTKFESKIPVPSYLFGIVAGDISETKIGNKTYLIAESSKLSEYASKLDKFEKALVVAENYMGPYVWGDYKIVVQPPSFPHGGMENPLLSFASPTIVTGEAASVFESIHEIAHSWAGNLMTHNTWLNVWLKEAFATFIERKVSKIMNGNDYYLTFAQRGKESMLEAIKAYGEEKKILTSLYPSSDTIKHPDEILNAVQAEKGFQFLVYIEQLIGEAIFEDFVIAFINTYKYQSVGVNEFEKYLVNFIYSKFESATAKEIYNKINFKAWLNEVGNPPVDIDFTNPSYSKAIAMAEEYIINGGSKSPSNYKDFNSYSVNLKYLFLDHFLKNTTKLTYNLVSRLDSDLSLYYLTTPELKSLFMQIAVVSAYYAPPFRYPSEFVGTNGRIEDIAPVYVRMVKADKFAAQDLYKKYEYFYHPTARLVIKQIVGL